MKNAFFATCSRHLEQTLQKEIEDISTKLGLQVEFITQRETIGGVNFETDDLSALKIMIHTRVASKIYKQIFKIWFDHEKDIPSIAKKLPWEKYLQNNSYKFTISLDRNISHKYKSPSYLAQLLNDGIKDRRKDNKIHMKNVEVDLHQADVNFVTRIESTKNNTIAIIYIDLCEFSLGHRGYRAPGHAAPLRENLAAALLMQTEWDPKTEPLIDSMCGTGTILFEAYLIAQDITPSYLNIKAFKENDDLSFSFLNHYWFREDKDLYNEILKYIDEVYYQNREKLKSDIEFPLYGFDIDASALRAFSECLELSKINPNHIKTKQSDATKITNRSPKEGVIICNPPYGERLNEVEALEALYYHYGENLKNNFKGFKAYILASNPDLRKKISLKTSKKIPFYNGPLECRLLEYKLY